VDRMKLCKDCRWVKNPGEFARCTRPSSSDPTGFHDGPQIHYCEIQRDAGWFTILFIGWSFKGNLCGRSGRFWQPKEAS
jgi:hypothetical protein